MNSLSSTLICACIALAAGTASAQDAMKKPDPMKKDMSMQECKDHMAMAKKDGMNKDAPKKDEATMKQESMCADMMKKDGMSGEPAKK